MPELPLTDEYTAARFLFYRGLFLTYLLAFLVAFRQFRPLCGEDGILPFTRRLENVSFLEAPSVLHWFPHDTAVRLLSVSGMVLSGMGLLGIEFLGPIATSACLFLLWVLYLSLIRAGGLFYGYGWETFLCEVGILSIFLGGAGQEVPVLLLFLYAWLLFRVMFGAGLIKIRGDSCWRDLTCMDYHYETQPMPNPLSWFAHHLPSWWHRMEVAGNHFVELMVPFAYFAPQPISGVAGLVTVLFMGWLMLTGNFSWLNFLTGVLAVLLIPDSFFTAAGLPVPGMELQAMSMVQQYLLVGFSGVVLVLSYFPIRNMISSEQVMNRGFDPFRLVNTYGAFGSITRVRYELVIQGRDRDGEWKTYQFPGKPTDPSRCPPQWAPYHLRLDWQLWFAAMRHRRARWLPGLVRKLLENDPSFTHLLHQNPFEDTEGPAAVRMHRYRYEFTKPEEGWKTGNWWNRTYVDEIIPPTALQDLKRT